jgi:hypothetical protein
MALDGPITGEVFLAYVEQVLIPTLQPDDIGVMEPAGPQDAAVRAAIAEAGAQFSLLRPIRPIEMAFANSEAAAPSG